MGLTTEKRRIALRKKGDLEILREDAIEIKTQAFRAALNMWILDAQQ